MTVTLTGSFSRHLKLFQIFGRIFQKVIAETCCTKKASYDARFGRQKRPTLTHRNFGLQAQKLMRFSSQDRKLNDHSF